MVKLLIILLRWFGVDILEERKQYLVSVPEDVREVAETLLPWIHTFEDVAQSTDWKRKEVYALGIKAFPDTPKNIIAYALEYAVWKGK